MTGAFFDLKNLAAYQKEESDQLHENQEHLNVLKMGSPVNDWTCWSMSNCARRSGGKKNGLFLTIVLQHAWTV